MTRRSAESGMVTAELAVAVPALLAVLVLALGAVRWGVDRVRVVDAAHVAARLVARGEPVTTATAAAGRAAPTGSHIAVAVSDGSVRVVVSVGPPAVLAAVGVGIPSRGVATARLEADGTATP